MKDIHRLFEILLHEPNIITVHSQKQPLPPSSWTYIIEGPLGVNGEAVFIAASDVGRAAERGERGEGGRRGLYFLINMLFHSLLLPRCPSRAGFEAEGYIWKIVGEHLPGSAVGCRHFSA